MQTYTFQLKSSFRRSHYKLITYYISIKLKLSDSVAFVI